MKSYLLNRAIKVIRSCETLDQLVVADRYNYLLVRRMMKLSSGFSNIFKFLSIRKELFNYTEQRAREINGK